MGFNPSTLQWIMDNLRMTIQSDVEGYPVTWYLYDSDFAGVDEDNVPTALNGIEIGWLQFILDERVKNHNALAPFRKRSEGAAQATESAPTGQWQCPEHGGMSVYDAKFGKGKQCNRWEAYNGGPTPTWANPTIRDVNGQKRVYCSYREFPR